jgi:hypothetical protein
VVTGWPVLEITYALGCDWLQIDFRRSRPIPLLHEADVDLACTMKSLIPISSLLQVGSTRQMLLFALQVCRYCLRKNWRAIFSACVAAYLLIETEPKLPQDVRSTITPYNKCNCLLLAPRKSRFWGSPKRIIEPSVRGNLMPLPISWIRQTTTDIRYLRLWKFKLLSSGVLNRVDSYVVTNVLEEPAASIFRELLTKLHGAITQNTRI